MQFSSSGLCFGLGVEFLVTIFGFWAGLYVAEFVRKNCCSQPYNLCTDRRNGNAVAEFKPSSALVSTVQSDNAKYPFEFVWPTLGEGRQSSQSEHDAVRDCCLMFAVCKLSGA